MWQLFSWKCDCIEIRNLKRKDSDWHARGKDMASTFIFCLVLGAKVHKSVLPWHVCEHKKAADRIATALWSIFRIPNPERILKVSSSVSKVKSFWGQEGKAGRQGGRGFFWWTRSLTVELSLEYLFPPTCSLPVWLKILCTSFFCLCSPMFSTILYSFLSFPPSNISCQSFLHFFN